MLCDIAPESLVNLFPFGASTCPRSIEYPSIIVCIVSELIICVSASQYRAAPCNRPKAFASRKKAFLFFYRSSKGRRGEASMRQRGDGSAKSFPACLGQAASPPPPAPIGARHRVAAKHTEKVFENRLSEARPILYTFLKATNRLLYFLIRCIHVYMHTSNGVARRIQDT